MQKYSEPGLLNILIVDDDKIIQIVNQNILESIGYKTTIMSNGVDALRLLENEVFSAVLLDINMPRLNGIEMTALLRKSQCINKDILIIGLTADNNVDTHNKAKVAGMNAVLVKPVEKIILTKLFQKLKIHSNVEPFT